ncbi:universal stress protein [Aquipuribacter nitratireducens]|uniref:Universal stress protein n=1 Tax=Aquipuribacter nitratireducens TaxID=650104 RepID=A0ABW0GIX7_9MICO
MEYRTVVVGYDGSDDAERAVDAAADEVSEGGTVHVVTAFVPSPVGDVLLPTELVGAGPVAGDPHGVEAARQRVALKRLRRQGVACEGHLVPDGAAAAILDVARREHADLVVVGGRGRGGSRRFVRGSVAARVASHAPVSVLVVHEPRAEGD